MSLLLDSVFFFSHCSFALYPFSALVVLSSSSFHIAIQHKIGCPFLGHLLQLSDGDSCRSQFLNQSLHFHLFGNVLCSSGTRRHQGNLAFFNAAKNGIESTDSARLTRSTGASRNGFGVIGDVRRRHHEGDRVDVQMYIRCHHPSTPLLTISIMTTIFNPIQSLQVTWMIASSFCQRGCCRGCCEGVGQCLP